MTFSKTYLSILVGVLQLLGAQSASVPINSAQSPISISKGTVRFQDICEGKDDGTMLADPENCQQFYVCYDGEGALASCLRRNCFVEKDTACEPCPGCQHNVVAGASPIEV
jgi:hypothetical protein